MPLLPVIYLCAISIGFPITTLGAAWPVIHGDLGVPISAAGIAPMVFSGFSMLPGLVIEYFISRFGRSQVLGTVILMSAAGMVGIALTHSFLILCLCYTPIGLQFGVAASANTEYVSRHYHARHTFFLNSCWGIGAMFGPALIARCINLTGWRAAYLFLAACLTLLSVAVFSVSKKWIDDGPGEKKSFSVVQTLKIPMLWCMSLGFFLYTAMEHICHSWTASYLVTTRNIDPAAAAKCSVLVVAGMTLGRIAAGLLSKSVSERNLIRLGIAGSLAAAAMFTFTNMTALSLFALGLGFAPIYPAIIRCAPKYFGWEHSTAVTGTLVAFAAAGPAMCNPLFGVLARHAGIGIFPIAFPAFLLAILLFTETVNRKLKV